MRKLMVLRDTVEKLYSKNNPLPIKLGVAYRKFYISVQGDIHITRIRLRTQLYNYWDIVRILRR